MPTDAIGEMDQARFRVPVTLLMGGLDEETFRRLSENWGATGAEFAAIEDAAVVRLDTAHWPQFTQPERLTEEILAAIG